MPACSSIAIFDACKPYEWLAEFPKEAAVSPELREQVLQKWGAHIQGRG